MKAKGIRACSGLLLAGLLLSGCNVGQINSRDFAQPGTAPPAGATVAVLPFENPTNHPNAGQIAADLVSTELYGVGGVRMVEAARVRGRLPPILFLPLSAGAQEVLPTDRTDPGHLRPPFRAYEPPPPGYQPRPRRTESRRVYALPQGLNGLATFDRTLSQLCRRGAFLQEIDGLYWAATPDFRYGVAFSGGANLVDPQNRRQPGKVYFFRNQDSRCSVWVGDQAKLMPHYIGG